MQTATEYRNRLIGLRDKFRAMKVGSEIVAARIREFDALSAADQLAVATAERSAA